MMDAARPIAHEASVAPSASQTRSCWMSPMNAAPITVAGEPAKGSTASKVMLVEVSDYHCPFCRRHTLTTQPQIDAEYINTGKLRYVFIDYPIDQLHPEAFKAHEAANCAGDQGKYWEMHVKLFEQPPPRESAKLTQLGLCTQRP